MCPFAGFEVLGRRDQCADHIVNVLTIYSSITVVPLGQVVIESLDDPSNIGFVDDGAVGRQQPSNLFT